MPAFTNFIILASLLSAAAVASPFSAQNEQRASKCPQDFRGTIFNTGIVNEGSVDNRWSVLSEHGVSNFIAFTHKSISQSYTYNYTKVGNQVNGAQIPVVMDPRNLTDAVSMLNGPHPPAVMELFNEPDFSYGGYTPYTQPADAAKDLHDVIVNPKRKTKLISPAPAFTTDGWLSQFFGNCTGCLEAIDYVGFHGYDTNVTGVIQAVENVRHQFGKPIWITEVGAASDPASNCNLTENEMITWMTTMVTWAAKTGYVEKLFWNNADWELLYAGQPARCNPSLTNQGGTPTALLTAYAGLC